MFLRYFAINVNDLVQFGEKSSYILSPLASLNLLATEDLPEINISIFVSHYSLSVLEKVFKEEKNENRKRDSRGVTTS